MVGGCRSLVVSCSKYRDHLKVNVQGSDSSISGDPVMSRDLPSSSSMVNREWGRSRSEESGQTWFKDEKSKDEEAVLDDDDSG